MNGLIKFAIAGLIGIGGGVFSAHQVIDGYKGLFVSEQGPWRTRPSAGTRSSNPYVRAFYLNQHRLPVSQFEVVELEARRDDKGEKLSPDCSYELSGVMPRARWWSLFTYAPGKLQPKDAIGKNGLSSQQVVFDDKNHFVVNISPVPKAGNWVMPNRDGDVVVVLRYYNAVQSVTSQFRFSDLPKIKRTMCS